MASITVRNLDDDLKRRLRIRAAEHGCSMEQEARDILGEALNGGPQVGPEGEEKGFGTILYELFAPVRGIELPIEPRGSIPSRELPRFD